ncbi:BamA/TamA family outer membrane protein [uncultured Draconibacterium sp.]|uniref:BamA/OMP85 family outer membrane protein n=1 Tax=uncultured Draconibacterium sp. TaxID=1573823 RepID=UPI003217A375
MRKIKFTGNKHFPDYKLRDEITIEWSTWFKEKIFGKEPVYYNEELYSADLQRIRIFYQKQGYLNVTFGHPKVVMNKRNKVKLTVPVVEGEPVLISDISYIVDSTYTIEQVLSDQERKKLEFKTEATATKIFRDQAITNDKITIAEAFYDEGYPYTLVKHKLEVDTTLHSTQLNWYVNRGPKSYFGPTNVVGNSRIKTKSILRQLDYNEGDVWSKKAIDQTQKQIFNQGNYRVASVKTQIGAELVDTLPMQIIINEAPRWSIRFGAGYGREDKIRAFTDVQYLSFLTNTGRLNFYAKHSGLEPYNLYLKFSQPSFLFPINTLTLYPFMQRQNEPGYKIDRIGYSITFLQNFSKELNTSIAFIYEDVDVDTTGYMEGSSAKDTETFYQKTGIALGGIYNNTDPILDPVQGFVVSFNTKTNDILFSGDMPFFRVLTEFKTYVGLQKGVVLALKAKMGGIKRTDGEIFIPVEERFFAGGSHSVRGWSRSDLGPQDEDGTPIGGNSLLESSAELRFDLGRELKLTVFADAGNVWKDSFMYKLNDLHYSTGFGLKYKTVIGPAGIDFARPVFDNTNKWQIHFNIGHSF